MFFERAELMWTVWNGYSAYTTLMGMLLLPNFKQKKNNSEMTFLNYLGTERFNLQSF